jgi:hypothetical protein
VLLEEAVLKWYSQQRSSGVGIHGVELKQQQKSLQSI